MTTRRHRRTAPVLIGLGTGAVVSVVVVFLGPLNKPAEQPRTANNAVGAALDTGAQVEAGQTIDTPLLPPTTPAPQTPPPTTKPSVPPSAGPGAPSAAPGAFSAQPPAGPKPPPPSAAPAPPGAKPPPGAEPPSGAEPGTPAATPASSKAPVGMPIVLPGLPPYLPALILPGLTPQPAAPPKAPSPARPVVPKKPALPPGQSGLAGQVVALTNAARAKNGCGPLKVDPRLVTSAQRHSADMSRRDYFEHESPEGKDFADREAAAGFKGDSGGENIAMGQTSAAEVMKDWMNSPGHRRNILDCSFTYIGVGYVADGNYWTQNFGG